MRPHRASTAHSVGLSSPTSSRASSGILSALSRAWRSPPSLKPSLPWSSSFLAVTSRALPPPSSHFLTAHAAA